MSIIGVISVRSACFARTLKRRDYIRKFGQNFASHSHYKLLDLATFPLCNNELFRNVGEIFIELENDSRKLLEIFLDLISLN